MNISEVNMILRAKQIDFIFILIGYIVNPLGLLFNGVLIYLITRKTTKSLRSYSILLLNFALCDFLSSLAGMLALQKTVFSGWSLTYIFHGSCGNVSPYFCYFLHCFVCHCFAHSQWILMISFLYRYYVLRRKCPPPCKVVKTCLWTYIPSLLFLFFYMLDVGNPTELKILIYDYHPQYYYNLFDLWGDLVVSGNKNVWSIYTLGAIVYMTIPCFPIYGIIVYVRYKTLNILDTSGRILMSETTRQSHKQLIKALTIQAIIPIFWLTAASFYLLLMFRIVKGVVIENMLFRIMEVMPMLTPLISMYFVTPYRLEIKSWFVPVPFFKPVIVSSMVFL